MYYLFFIGGVVLVAFAVGIICESSRLLSRNFEALLGSFPRGREFFFGAMFGFYAGVVPAIVAYAVIHRIWAAGVVDGGFLLAGGVGWMRICGRSGQRKASSQQMNVRQVR